MRYLTRATALEKSVPELIAAELDKRENGSVISASSSAYNMASVQSAAAAFVGTYLFLGSLGDRNNIEATAATINEIKKLISLRDSRRGNSRLRKLCDQKGQK